eukprot:scaffold271961_cov17-Tisochrysis_lutea.AAC.1
MCHPVQQSKQWGLGRGVTGWAAFRRVRRMLGRVITMMSPSLLSWWGSLSVTALTVGSFLYARGLVSSIDLSRILKQSVLAVTIVDLSIS